MKKYTLYLSAILCFGCCMGQDKIEGRYIGFKLDTTQNVCFLSKVMRFVDEKSDTLRFSVKLPFDNVAHEVEDPGIFYNCHLKEGVVYTISLQKMCVEDIPQYEESYYITNTIPDEEDCSKYTEKKLDTKYRYYGNYGRHVDIDNVLYEIVGVSPNGGCFYPH